MQERQVTIDGVSHPLSPRFTVVATQNPIEQQGTYPLPEAQLDRFLFKHVLDYPTIDQERAIIAAHGARTGQMDPVALGVQPVADRATIDAAVATVADVRLTDEVIGYIVDLVRATRDSADTDTGASPRAGAMLAVAARARAALDGRTYVIPDDVKVLAAPTLRHRLLLSPAAEIEGRMVDQVLQTLIEQVAVPR
jgi:MoxR-like ATPase